MKRLTIEQLHKRFPDFEVVRKGGEYDVKYRPWDTYSACVLGAKNLNDIENFLKDQSKVVDKNKHNHGFDRAYFRHPATEQDKASWVKIGDTIKVSNDWGRMRSQWNDEYADNLTGKTFVVKSVYPHEREGWAVVDVPGTSGYKISPHLFKIVKSMKRGGYTMTADQRYRREMEKSKGKNYKEGGLIASKGQWEEYRAVQDGGYYNMFDPRAREMTSMSREEYLDIIKNYGKYQDKYGRDSDYAVEEEIVEVKRPKLKKKYAEGGEITEEFNYDIITNVKKEQGESDFYYELYDKLVAYGESPRIAFSEMKEIFDNYEESMSDYIDLPFAKGGVIKNTLASDRGVGGNSDKIYEIQSELKSDGTQHISLIEKPSNNVMAKGEMDEVVYFYNLFTGNTQEAYKGYAKGGYTMYDWSDSFDVDKAQYIDNEFQLFDTKTGKTAYPTHEEKLYDEVREGEGRYQGKIVKYYELDGEQYRKEFDISGKDFYAKGGKIKKGNEMLIGGLAGILLGVFLGK